MVGLHSQIPVWPKSREETPKMGIYGAGLARAVFAMWSRSAQNTSTKFNMRQSG